MKPGTAGKNQTEWNFSTDPTNYEYIDRVTQKKVGG